MSTAAAQFGKVAVLMGGASAERDISLQSGNAVLQALIDSGVDAHAFDPSEQNVCALLELEYDHAFVVLHGRGGEDGVIQGALESIDLPYTGSGVAGCALSMDKLTCKRLWSGMGLPTPPFRVLNESTNWQEVINHLGLPLMVKPVHEGSSLGMTQVNEADMLAVAWEKAAAYDPVVIAEQWIDGAEYTAAILGNEVLPLIRLETPREFYDYAAKYEQDDTSYICPCGLSDVAETQCGQLALAAFESVSASGWGRVDFMMDKQGKSWLIEVNTVPGMTGHSLVPMAARAAGMDFPSLVLAILEESLTKDMAGVNSHGT